MWVQISSPLKKEKAARTGFTVNLKETIREMARKMQAAIIGGCPGTLATTYKNLASTINSHGPARG